MVMFYISMVPPIWRQVMHPVLEIHYDTANITPHGYSQDLPERLKKHAVDWT
jgi:hypothetical protein